MTKHDTIRITLRLPAELHERVSDSASDCAESLNAQIVRLIQTGLEEDVFVRLMGLPEEDWLKELKSMRQASEERYDSVWQQVKRLWALKSGLGIKKSAA